MTDSSASYLTIGATGMLAGTTRALARPGAPVWVLSRNADQFVAHETGDLRAIPGSYRDPKLIEQLPENVHTILAWMHGSDWTFLEQATLATGAKRVVHVLGSSASDPSIPSDPPHLQGCRYDRVILGFVIEPAGSRWLTHAEISKGVLEAIDAPQPTSIVGTVTPWSARP